jgi:hypothetical protein
MCVRWQNCGIQHARRWKCTSGSVHACVLAASFGPPAAWARRDFVSGIDRRLLRVIGQIEQRPPLTALVSFGSIQKCPFEVHINLHRYVFSRAHDSK